MKSLLLMSVLFAQILIPALAARDVRPRRGLRRMLALLAVFNVLYVLYLSQLHPLIYIPHWP